jgi:radical SAM protein with 4Fe4S-binding SPASM domain
MNNSRHLARIPTGISYLLKHEKTWGQPVFFTIETVNSCNFRCIYCPQSDQGNHFINGQGTMSFDDFKTIVANIRSAFDVRIVSLHRDGEPLMNKRLEEFIAHLTELGIYVTVSSNCSLLPEERAKRLIASGLRMAATDFCADPEIYERLRARGVWTKTLDGIRNLLRAGVEAKADFRVVIKDIATNDCPSEKAGAVMEQTRKLFAEWPDRVSIVPVYFHNALGESLVNLSNAQTPGPSPAIDGHYTLCHQPWVNFTVDYAGRVVGCCRDLRSEYVLGNLLHEPAGEIWNGEKMRQLRRALAEKHPEQIDICKSCDAPWQGSYSGRTPLEKVRKFFFDSLWQRT